jgi:hypothetical protein
LFRAFGPQKEPPKEALIKGAKFRFNRRLSQIIPARRSRNQRGFRQDLQDAPPLHPVHPVNPVKKSAQKNNIFNDCSADFGEI